jgi:glycine cleavage system regulatory protein
MAASFVLTISGRDRPGVVENVADAVSRCGASWQESRMARLAGRFSGIVQVSVPDAAIGALTAALEELRGDELDLVFEPTRPEFVHADYTHFVLELVGQDRTGIVREISAALASHGVNVVELTTECSSAPMSGEMLFSASAQLCCPSDMGFEALREALERLADDLMVDINLEESPSHTENIGPLKRIEEEDVS